MALTFCKICNVYDDKPKCPKCGSHVTAGYGLAGGGIGYYKFCCDDDCDYFEKTQDADEDFDRGACPGCGGSCAVACR